MDYKTNHDIWFYRAAAYGYNAAEKDDQKRLHQITLEEYFNKTFSKEIREKWKYIKKKVLKNKEWFGETIGEKFDQVDLARFMEENKNSQIVS